MKLELSNLRFPAMLPSGEMVLRRCTPVIHKDKQMPAFGGRELRARGIWTPSGSKADEGMVLWDLSSGTRPRFEFPVYAGLLDIDLTDVTGRTHLGWWLSHKAKAATRHGPDGGRKIGGVEDLNPEFRASAFFRIGEPCLASVSRHRHGGLAIRLDQCHRVDSYGAVFESHHHWCHIDHCVTEIDMEDHTELPDGSRLVDAFVLLSVARRVAMLDDQTGEGL